MAYSIDLGQAAGLAKPLLMIGDGSRNCGPDTTGSVASWEAESSVQTLVSGDLVHDHVVDEEFEVWRGDTLAQPGTLHLDFRLVYTEQI